MITFFYAFLIVFIWNEIYYIRNGIRLNENFKNKDIQAITKLDFVYYLTKVMYWGWILTGMLFSSFHLYFLALFVFGFFKFLIYHVNQKSYIIYDKIVPVISILILILILVFKFIC